jgi:hypothetical protein
VILSHFSGLKVIHGYLTLIRPAQELTCSHKGKTPMRKLLIPFTFLLMISVALSHAEEIIIPLGQQGMEQTDIPRPSLGTTMSDVKQLLGQPVKTTDAIGTPPIIRWEYPDLVVYFESNRVIHTVLKHSKKL